MTIITNVNPATYDLSMDFNVKNNQTFDILDLSGHGSKFFVNAIGKYGSTTVDTDFSCNLFPQSYSSYKIESIKRETNILDPSFNYSDNVPDISVSLIPVFGEVQKSTQFRIQKNPNSNVSFLPNAAGNDVSYELTNYLFYNLFDVSGNFYQKMNADIIPSPDRKISNLLIIMHHRHHHRVKGSWFPLRFYKTPIIDASGFVRPTETCGGLKTASCTCALYNEKTFAWGGHFRDARTTAADNALIKKGFDASNTHPEWYNYQQPGNPYDPREGIWGWYNSNTHWGGDGIDPNTPGIGFLLEFNPPTEINYIGWGQLVNYTDNPTQTNFLEDATINFYVSKSTSHGLTFNEHTDVSHVQRATFNWNKAEAIRSSTYSPPVNAIDFSKTHIEGFALNYYDIAARNSTEWNNDGGWGIQASRSTTNHYDHWPLMVKLSYDPISYTPPPAKSTQYSATFELRYDMSTHAHNTSDTNLTSIGTNTTSDSNRWYKTAGLHTYNGISVPFSSDGHSSTIDGYSSGDRFEIAINTGSSNLGWTTCHHVIVTKDLGNHGQGNMLWILIGTSGYFANYSSGYNNALNWFTYGSGGNIGSNSELYLTGTNSPSPTTGRDIIIMDCYMYGNTTDNVNKMDWTIHVYNGTWNRYSYSHTNASLVMSRLTTITTKQTWANHGVNQAVCEILLNETRMSEDDYIPYLKNKWQEFRG